MSIRAVVIAAGAHIFRAAHLPALTAAGVEVVGVYDTDAVRVRELASAHGWPVAPDVDALLAVDADAAIICAPHPLHAELIARCIRAGRSVLVEKPVAARLSEIDALIAQARGAGLTVAVVQQHRLRDDVGEALRAIRAGELGRIHRAVLTASYPKRSRYYTDSPWRGTWRGEGGGVALNQGLHDLDLLVHFLGRPRRVLASMRTLVHPIEAEDTADLLIEWAEGSSAAVHITSAVALEGNSLEIYGSAAALRLTAAGLERRDADEDFDTFARAAGGHFDPFPAGRWQTVVGAGGGSHRAVYDDFASAWASDVAPAVSLEDARPTVELLAAAALSDQRRGWVDLPVDPAEFDFLLDTRIARSDAQKVAP